MSSQEEKDKLVKNLASLVAALAVPVSLGMPLGKATSIWSDIHTQLIGLGWASSEEYEAKIRGVIGI